MGQEAIKRYEKFVESLPSKEQDKPYIKAPSGAEKPFYSPNDVLRHLRAQDEIGQKIQNFLDQYIKTMG